MIVNSEYEHALAVKTKKFSDGLKQRIKERNMLAGSGLLSPGRLAAMDADIKKGMALLEAMTGRLDPRPTMRNMRMKIKKY